MDEERRQILEMVRDGVISADDAERLLRALAPHELAPERATEMMLARAAPGSAGERRFRRWWEIPFALGLILFGAAALCVLSTSSTLLRVGGWGCAVVAALVVILAWLSQWTAWVHVRIHEQDGPHIAISLPLPLRLIHPLLGWVGALTRRFAGDDTAAQVDTALAMLAALDELPDGQPLSVEVDDEDGDHIQVYIG